MLDKQVCKGCGIVEDEISLGCEIICSNLKLAMLKGRENFEREKRKRVAADIKSYIINNSPYLPSMITPEAWNYAEDMFQARFMARFPVFPTRQNVR
jgi:hypothetical protein